ncbi:MAG: lipid II flippase MurJ [Planctomycetota bacterium]|jgi:putative peptidoglycan lipid II flippase
MGVSDIQQRDLVQSDRRRADSPAGGGSLVRTVFGLSTIVVFAKIFGFAEKVVVAGFFGTDDTADVYWTCMGIVLSIVFFVRELVYPSFLPVFAGSLAELPSVPGALFKKVFSWAAAFLAGTALILVAFPEVVTGLLAPGFSGSKRQLTVNLLRVLGPGAFLLGLMMVTYTTLNAHKRFVKAALPEAALKLFVVLGMLALVPILGIYALALVLALGAMAGLGAHLYFIPERRFLLHRPIGSDAGAYFRKVLLLMGPLVVGVAFSHISGLVDGMLASRLPTGQLSYLGYSKRLIDAILLVGPVALMTVVYSHLSHLASAGQYERFVVLVTKVFRVLVYLVVPGACVLIGLRVPLIRCLLQRGRFDAGSTSGTSEVFMVYGFGLLTFSLETLLVYSFFALSDTKTPVKYGVLCVFLDIALAVLLVQPFAGLGIAAAFVISKTIKIIILAKECLIEG